MSFPAPPLILLAGPTATGKTALAIDIARQLGGEIISADSMQVYRGCAVGTAQPTHEELGTTPYHLVGCVEPDIAWSVADWLRTTRALIADLHSSGKPAIVAGGTGLYFKALTEGLFETDRAGRDPELRKRLETEWDVDGGESLRNRLAQVDPEATERIHRNDKLRHVRALEVFHATGLPMTQLQRQDRRERKPFVGMRFVLTAGRSGLYERIDRRVVEMVASGFPEEVRNLLAKGAQEDWPAMRALGYRQLLRADRGEMTKAEAIEETQRLSRRYAKQQMVLYRNWAGAVWLDAERGVKKNSRAVQKILEFTHPRPV